MKRRLSKSQLKQIAYNLYTDGERDLETIAKKLDVLPTIAFSYLREIGCGSAKEVAAWEKCF